MMSNDGLWQNPVVVELRGLGQYRVVASNAEAVDCLLEEWPADEGEAYQDALTICLAAADGRSSCDIARDAFLEAALQAYIYVDPCGRYQLVS
ncbi:hypothetical protein ATY81_16750 [Rhizobium sp. R72]|nr:hypothetical protein ATY81_16750 [Rhizobium sp. R72]OWV93010.1 hypothetical protein ATY80_16750 [Rhizobium sp. R711]